MSKKHLEATIKKLVAEQFRRLRDRNSQPSFQDSDEIEDYFNSDLDMSDTPSKKSPEELRSFWDVMMTEDAPPPEADKDDAFGTHLFGNQRDIEEDPNTPEEDRFYDALDDHVVSNESGRLGAIIPQLLDFKNQGKYAEFLEPPDKPLYRFLSDIPVELAAQRLGMPVEEVKKMSGEVFQSTGSPAPYSPRKGLASWSTEPTKLSGFVKPAYRNSVVLLLKTNKNNGNFVLNPYSLKKATTDVMKAYLENENEVVSYGDVAVDEAAFLYIDADGTDLTSREVTNLLIDAVS